MNRTKMAIEEWAKAAANAVLIPGFFYMAVGNGMKGSHDIVAVPVRFYRLAQPQLADVMEEIVGGSE